MKLQARAGSLIIKYATILTLLNGIHFLYKNYDRTYDSLWQYDWRGILFHVFFVFFGWIIWEAGLILTRFTNQQIRKRHLQKLQFPILTIVLIFYGLLFTVLYGKIYYHFFFVHFKLEHLWADYQPLDRDLLVIMFVMYLIIVGFHAFIHYYQNWKEAELTAERLQKENIRSRYETLKHQIDPHFFFNSLSVLTSLVYKDADKSAAYISQLSRMYRYILEGKDQTVVPLEQELEFLDSYIFLMSVRHENSIRFDVQITDETRKHTFIPKNSLQMLAENAVKHNRFSQQSPLSVRVFEDDEFIKVINNLDRRELIECSSGIGLENIRKRYQLISQKDVELEETAFTFCVKLPKLSKRELKNIDF